MNDDPDKIENPVSIPRKKRQEVIEKPIPRQEEQITLKKKKVPVEPPKKYDIIQFEDVKPSPMKTID